MVHDNGCNELHPCATKVNLSNVVLLLALIDPIPRCMTCAFELRLYALQYNEFKAMRFHLFPRLKPVYGHLGGCQASRSVEFICHKIQR